MQMFGDSMKVYDESEYAKYPYCSRKKEKIDVWYFLC